jgi:hypothetical protein
MKLICTINILSLLNINLSLFYPIVHVENTNSVDLYIETMRYIEILIKDIYELDKFLKNWKSCNIYHLPKHVFFRKKEIPYKRACGGHRVCIFHVSL